MNPSQIKRIKRVLALLYTKDIGPVGICWPSKLDIARAVGILEGLIDEMETV